MKMMLIAVLAALQLTASPKMEGIYSYMNKETDYSVSFSFMTPQYIVFPDKQCTLEEAQTLVSELGLDEGEIARWMGGVFVFSPSSASYNDEKDLQRFTQFYNFFPVHTNIKVVGIGAGASFVNRTIAPLAEFAAGIVTIGGAPAKVSQDVPAYVAGKNAARVAKSYIAAAGAQKIGTVGKAVVYENPSDSLMRVVVGDNSLTLKEMMAQAWDMVLCRNVRFSNYNHTCYMGDKLEDGYPFEIEPFLVPERIGMKKNICEKSLVNRRGDYLWFEYYNEAVENAPQKSVPLVVLLHGNGNDPRTQAETSGFIQLAARENFMVIELEWQGTNKKNEWMGMDGIEKTIYEVLSKYPQLDPSRVYAEGLSAGGFCATALGVHKSYLFAAVGSHSGGVARPPLDEGTIYGTAFNPESLYGDATQKAGNTVIPYFQITGTTDDAVAFPESSDPEKSCIYLAWNLYRHYNGLEPLEGYDTSVDPVFGHELSGRTTQTIKGFSVQSGDVVVGGIPVMRLVAVEKYGHWNFVPGAEMMWEYFKHFSRDQKTRKLIYTE